ncbi:MAG: right-handed parallel beta-helix repeat-containing protein [Armatimonadetes bacterium]|nr:right-handed parallel beta-helix repeat-containing protein [Armatimonadota bacterium]
MKGKCLYLPLISLIFATQVTKADQWKTYQQLRTEIKNQYNLKKSSNDPADRDALGRVRILLTDNYRVTTRLDFEPNSPYQLPDKDFVLEGPSPSSPVTLVAGDVVDKASWKPASLLPLSVQARLPLNTLSKAYFLDKTQVDHFGSWPLGNGGNDAHVGISISTHEVNQPITAMIGDTTLRFASEPIDRDIVGEENRYYFNHAGSVGGTGGYEQIAFKYEYPLPNGLLGNQKLFTGSALTFQTSRGPLSDVRCSVYNAADFKEVNCGVYRIIETIDLDLKRRPVVELTASPFDIYSASPKAYNKHQRFCIFNALEFLDEPGEMVLITEPGSEMIVFIPPTTSNGGDLNSIYLGVADVQNSSEINQDTFSFNQCKNAGIKNIRFSASQSEFLRIDNCTDFSIDSCDFQAMGQGALHLIGGSNISINDCIFKDGYRGFIGIGGEGDYAGGQSNLTLGNRYISGISSNISLNRCTFVGGGLLYPSVVALLLDNYPIGVKVESCQFLNTTATAISVSGSQNTVNNTTIKNCVRYSTDASSVYFGRSWIQSGNTVSNCLLQNINNKDPNRGNYQPGQTYAIDVGGVMLDDFMAGTSIAYNSFDNCQYGIVCNGGRYNLFLHNQFVNGSRALRPYYICVNSITNPQTVAQIEFHYQEARKLILAEIYGETSFSNPLGWKKMESFGCFNSSYNNGVAVNDLKNLRSYMSDEMWEACPTLFSVEPQSGETPFGALQRDFYTIGVKAWVVGFKPVPFMSVPPGYAAIANKQNIFVWDSNDFIPAANASDVYYNPAFRGGEFFYGYISKTTANRNDGAAEDEERVVGGVGSPRYVGK